MKYFPRSLSVRIVLGVLVLGCMGFGWYLLTLPEAVPVVVGSRTVTYVAEGGTASMVVGFDAAGARLSGASYDGVLLARVPTAEGEVYASENGLVSLNVSGADIELREGREVRFRGRDQAYVVSQTEAPAVDVAPYVTATTWYWRETVMSTGEVITPSTPGAYALTLAEGTVSLATDCNSFTGSYALEGALLTVGPLAQTKKFCGGSNEQVFASVFSEPLTVFFDPTGALVLLLPEDRGSVFFGVR